MGPSTAKTLGAWSPRRLTPLPMRRPIAAAAAADPRSGEVVAPSGGLGRRVLIFEVLGRLKVVSS
eukprot:scaffold67856_cov28-Tisochrysis_lutea.AAC.3